MDRYCSAVSALGGFFLPDIAAFIELICLETLPTQTSTVLNINPHSVNSALRLVFALQGEHRRSRSSGGLGQHLCDCHFPEGSRHDVWSPWRRGTTCVLPPSLMVVA